MPANDLGESAKELMFSALTKVLGREPTSINLEGLTEERKEVMFVEEPKGKEPGHFWRTRKGMRIEITAEVTTHLGEQITVSACCIFEIPRFPGDCRPNSIWLELDDREEPCDFYAPDKHSLFRLKGASQI